MSEARAVTVIPTRLPYIPELEQRYGIAPEEWRALVDAVFPSAKTIEGVMLALSYCRSRKLDPFKRPVHIVPVWNNSLGREVETVWPGIGELRTTAHRTGLYQGCDSCEFGPDVTKEFTGDVGRRGSPKMETVEVTFPEWAQLTVYRSDRNGSVSTWHGPRVCWLETYGRRGKSEVPNEMWARRSRGQLEKCAEAAALRRAFPEEVGELLVNDEIGDQMRDVSPAATAVPSTSVLATFGSQVRPAQAQTPAPEAPPPQPAPEPRERATEPRQTPTAPRAALHTTATEVRRHQAGEPPEQPTSVEVRDRNGEVIVLATGDVDGWIAAQVGFSSGDDLDDLVTANLDNTELNQRILAAIDDQHRQTAPQKGQPPAQTQPPPEQPKRTRREETVKGTWKGREWKRMAPIQIEIRDAIQADPVAARGLMDPRTAALFAEELRAAGYPSDDGRSYEITGQGPVDAVPSDEAPTETRYPLILPGGGGSEMTAVALVDTLELRIDEAKVKNFPYPLVLMENNDTTLAEIAHAHPILAARCRSLHAQLVQQQGGDDAGGHAA